MPIGAFTGQFDLPLLLVILFFVFFACLIYYLHQEDKREGYPLVDPSRKDNRIGIVGFPNLPKPKTFIVPHGRAPVTVPAQREEPPVDADNLGNARGLPITPVGDPLLSRAGPAAWMPREEEPELSWDNEPVFVPLRNAKDFRVKKGDSDPRGFDVLGCDKKPAGRVVDIWVDRSEHSLKFYEVEVAAHILAAAPENRGDRILLPEEFGSLDGRKRHVRTGAITAAQFARVPRTREGGIVTSREEDRIRGYFGGGLLWATPDRAEPFL